MNAVRALAIAAAALVTGIYCGGPASAQAAAAAAERALDRTHIRATVNELADMLGSNYVFPDVGAQYAALLHQRAAAGAYDGLDDSQALAETLTTDLNTLHHDAHLRVTLADPEHPASPHVTPPAGETAFGDDRWLGDRVAYVRITLLPDDQASVDRMHAILDRYTSARAIVFDLRRCYGGSLEVMDEVFSRLFSRRTRLVNMDTRPDGLPELQADFDSIHSLVRDRSAPANIHRWVHWATPTAPVSPLANAQVFLLTDLTASACEHMTLALKSQHRATLVGATTRGAGHYGGVNAFGDGRFNVFVPVGRTYVPETGQEWEGTGIAPDVAVPPQEALNAVLTRLNVPQSAASEEVARAPEPPRRRVASSGPSYGIGLSPPRGGEPNLPVLEVAADSPAARAGLQEGDHILSLNGTAVSQIAPNEMSTYFHDSPLVVVVERGGQQRTLTMTLPPQASSSTSQ
jgi:C-terminal processing protease CtpA/Prc